MKHAPIQIRNDEVVSDIRELAALRKQALTEAVATAVRNELEREKRVSDAERERRLRAIRGVVERFNALPTVGPMLTDDDLYDPHGLPK